MRNIHFEARSNFKELEHKYQDIDYKILERREEPVASKLEKIKES